MKRYNQILAALGPSAHLHTDANETAAFARQLEFIETTVLEKKYPESKWMSLVPVKSNVPAWAEADTFRVVEWVGDAALGDLVSFDDSPTVELRGTEFTNPIRTLKNKYHYTMLDLKRAAVLSIGVEATKALAARKMIEMRIDSLTFSGGGPFTGLLGNASSQDDTAFLGTPNWDTGTPEDIAEDFRAIGAQAFTISNGLFEEFDVVLSPKLKAKLSQRYNTYSDKSIETYVLESIPFIRSISYTPRAAGAGASGKERMLVYPRSPEVLEVVVPNQFSAAAPQLKGQGYDVYCEAQFGGLRIYHPTMIRRADITAS